MRIDLSDMLNFEYLINNKLSASEIDYTHQIISEPLVETTHPFIHVPLKKESYFDYMAKEANDIHALCSNNEFFIIAFYNDTSHFPVARAYFLKKYDFKNVSIILNKYNALKKVYSEDNYGKFLLQEGFYIDRIVKYRQKIKDNKKNQIIQELFDGRKNNTCTDYGLRLSTEKCIICHNELYCTVSSTLVHEKGLFFNYDVCKSCYDTMKKNDISPINYFSRYCTGTDFVTVHKLSTKEILKEVKEFLKDELDCTILKCNKKDTITAERKKSKIKIVFRLTAMLDYGYMFFEPNGKQFTRIDSTKDHPELIFQPDHIHDSKQKKDFNKNVRESFSTGMPIIDKKIILDILEKKELEFI